MTNLELKFSSIAALALVGGNALFGCSVSANAGDQSGAGNGGISKAGGANSSEAGSGDQSEGGSGDQSEAGSGGQSGAGNGAESEAGAAGAMDTSGGVLPFSPSNITLAGMDVSQVADQELSQSCNIASGADGAQGCFDGAVYVTQTQADGTKVNVVIVKSIHVEPQVHIHVTGSLPLVIVSLGDFSLLGTFDAAADGYDSGPGGFTALMAQAGFGPGGGPVGKNGHGAGGGSYCGLGGKGAVEFQTTSPAGAPTPAYGSEAIRPLIGGSSGGGGFFDAGAGGGAIQFVAGGKFTLGAAAYINVGGGGSSAAGATLYAGGGGGSGGSILIEGKTVQLAGLLAANGGGSGDGSDGNATPDTTPAPGGQAHYGDSTGGPGSAGATINGSNATQPTKEGGASGGGGGAGRIRINSASGTVDLSNATFSPAASTQCVTQGSTGQGA
ncbi:MAG: hypothetical protein ABI488_24655 [Polyangiaceae bacterium]